MKRYLTHILLTIGIMISSFHVSAELVVSDWQNEGDSQSIYDDSSGLTWLKLDATAGMSINEVLADSTFNGWRPAQQSEVDSLISQNLSTGDSAYTDAMDWNDVFGGLLSYYQGRATYEGAYGWYMQDNGEDVLSSGTFRHIYKKYTYRHDGKSDSAYSRDHTSSITGVYLVKSDPIIFENDAFNIINVNDVPAESSILLAGLLIPLLRRRRKN